MKQAYMMFAMDDTGQRQGVIPIDDDQAKSANAKNYGIFWCLNEFSGSRRVSGELSRITQWSIDIDAGDKEKQMERIKSAPLTPTMVVETKRGYQVYWFAKDATKESFKDILEYRLIPYFNADIRAKDMCRILRVPGYYHCKDPKNKFMVKEVWLKPLVYSEAEMLTFFKNMRPESKKQSSPQGGLWDKSGEIDVEVALSKLSGTAFVNGEVFEIKENRNGTKQIWVNGKSTSSWIDVSGMIGSYDRGGPTIAQWLNWYCRDYKRVAEILKEVFCIE